MNKLRILQIVGDPVGGIRKHVHDILLGLKDDFDLCYISSGNGDKTYHKEIDQIRSNIIFHQALNINKRPSFSDLVNIIKIYRFIRANDIDIVHGHGAKGGLYARICGKLAGCKIVYTPHGGVVHNMFGKYEDILYKTIERFLCNYTDLLIFESKYTEKSFQSKFGCSKSEHVVNYNGVQPPSKNQIAVDLNHNESLPVKLGVFAMLRQEKGQILALRAVTSLIKQGHNIQLHFYGEGSLKEALTKEVGESGLDNNIIFHGEVDDVYSNMYTVDFVLIPSLFESFGYVAVESIFANKPIISSNTGGLIEIVDENSAFMFESANQSSLEKAIINAINSIPESILKKKQNAFTKAHTLFEIERMLGQLKLYYFELYDN
jgi:glycosyltransferase involved in cell wall biosynthesis